MNNNRANIFNELENRCLDFSLKVKAFCNNIEHDIINQVYISHVILSSASIGSNYIEGNEKIEENDLIYKVKITKKETKETIFWLNHFDESDELEYLLDEADQLRKIFSSIISKLNINNTQNNNINN